MGDDRSAARDGARAGFHDPGGRDAATKLLTSAAGAARPDGQDGQPVHRQGRPAVDAR